MPSMMNGEKQKISSPTFRNRLRSAAQPPMVRPLQVRTGPRAMWKPYDIWELWVSAAAWPPAPLSPPPRVFVALTIGIIDEAPVQPELSLLKHCVQQPPAGSAATVDCKCGAIYPLP